MFISPDRLHAQTITSHRSKPGKIDKKYYIFGELHEEGEETNLIGRIKRILRESVDGLLAASEVFILYQVQMMCAQQLHTFDPPPP